MKLKICLLAGILAISYFYCLAQEGKSQFKQLNITKEEKSIEASDPDVKKEIVYVRKESKGYIFTGKSDVFVYYAGHGLPDNYPVLLIVTSTGLFGSLLMLFVSLEIKR